MAFKVKRSKPKYEWQVDRYKVYSFKNLPKEAQDKAIEKHYNINVDYDWWDYDGIADAGLPNLNQKSYMESAGVKRGGTFFDYDKRLAFDLDRGNYLQFNNLKPTDDNAFREVLGVSKKTWDKVSYNFVNDRERDTELDFYENEELSEKEKAELDNAREVFKEIMLKNKEALRENYEYQTSEEAIKETFEANDYRFKENGDIA